MVRKPEHVFAPEKNTAARRDFIDYDYIDQLTPEEAAWLAQFTDEYLGASFSINPTYCSRKDAIKICKLELQKSPDSFKCRGCGGSPGRTDPVDAALGLALAAAFGLMLWGRFS